MPVVHFFAPHYLYDSSRAQSRNRGRNKIDSLHNEVIKVRNVAQKRQNGDDTIDSSNYPWILHTEQSPRPNDSMFHMPGS